MGRKCKCQICKTQLDTDTAFKMVYVSQKTGKPRNVYFCNEKEYRESESEKIFLKKCQLEVDKILGYTCVNNAKNKELAKLVNSGYTRKQIYKVMVANEDNILNGLELKGDSMNEYQQIRYIYTIVANKLRDTYSNRTKVIERDTTEYEYNNENIEIDNIQVKTPYKNKKRKSGLLDIL